MNIIYKTIKTRNRHYVYDRNANRILSIDESDYNKLLEQEKKIDKEFDDNFIRKFQEKGFLLENQLEIIENPLTRYSEHILNHYKEQLILQVTQRCNLRCEYCVYSEKGEYHNRKHSNNDMSVELAEKAINMYLDASNEAPDRVISFYGGEPLLKIELIKHCVEYVKKKSIEKKVRFAMTTNGTLLTMDIARFLAENNFEVLISLDGSKNEHNEYRKFANGKGSFDTIMNNLRAIRKELPDFFKTIQFNTVLNPKHNYENIKEYFQTDEIVADATLMHTLVEENDSSTNIDFRKEFTRSREYDHFLLLLHMLNHYSFESLNKFVKLKKIMISRKHEQLMTGGYIGKINHPSGPCMPGSRRIFVNVKGNLYPCEKVSENCEQERIGNIDIGLDLEKINNILNIGKLTEDECKKCWAFQYCNMCCNKAEKDNILCREARLSHCKLARKAAYYDLKEICILKEFGCEFKIEMFM